MRNTTKHDRLIIFGRYPMPGQTKTRLIPELGPVGAAELQRKLTEKTLATAQEAKRRLGFDIEVCFDGASEARIQQWLGKDLIYSKQVQEDLGKRMHAAFQNAFKKGCKRVVLLGTDIPELTSEHLNNAFVVLKDYDLVLGPSIDGGYWLMGLKQSLGLFEGVQWGSPFVLKQTLSIAQKKSLHVFQLKSCTDIDTIEDLKAEAPQWVDSRPFLSVIIPAFNEESDIAETIQQANDLDAEIIMVDGGSTDHTVTRAIQAGARIIKSLKGRAWQQNIGAKKARGDVLLFLHADTTLPAGYIHNVFEALMNPKTIAGAFRFKTTLHHPLMKIIEFNTNIRSRFLSLPYGDQGIFIRKSVFHEMGGYPDVPIAEDLFLMRQLRKMGRINIVPAFATISARRWQTLGIFRTTLINQIILIGCYLRVSPNKLAPLYRIPDKQKRFS